MIWLTTAFILFITLLLPAFLALGLSYIPYGVQPPLDKTKDVFGGNYIKQTFTSQRENLAGVSMTIKNPNLKNKKDIYLHLYDKDNKQIRESKLNGLNIEDGSYVKFLFDPITDSKNKEFSFILISPDSNEEEVLPIFYTERKPDWIGQMQFEKEDHPGGVSFVTLHVPGSKLETIGEIYSNWLGRLLLHRSQKSL